MSISHTIRIAGNCLGKSSLLLSGASLFFLAWSLFLGFSFFFIDCAYASTESEEQYLRSLISKVRVKNLANERYWHLLLHYEIRWLGQVKSKADGTGFFLSPEGKTNPQAEIEASLSAFFDSSQNTQEKQHPQCRFPARYAWLKKQLNFDPNHLSEQTCVRFNAWKDRLGAKSVTMIFADAYLDNPPSMYGHTFLRLDKTDFSSKQHLLDYSVNFSADTNTKNGIVFAIKGLSGGYDGRFSTTPFYIKVQSYSNLESRDLWEYHLNLDQKQTDRLVRHLWELGSTSFDYYFLTENCSYQLLPLIEIADPSLHLTDSLKPWIIPIDTVQALLSAPGLVTEINRRPSQINQMLARRSLLLPHEIPVAESISKQGDEENYREIEHFPEERQVLILDAAYDYYRYREGFSRDRSKKKKKIERKILLKRRKLNLKSPELDALQNGIPPHTAHRTGRIGFSFGLTENTAFEEISLRPALHDLAADSIGYIPYSHLEMFHLKIRYDNDDRKPFLEKFSLIEIISLIPSDPWVQKASWKVKLGLDQAKELDCTPRKCTHFQFNAGKGLSRKFRLFEESLAYALAEVDLGFGNVFQDKYRGGAGASMGLLMQLTQQWRIHIEGTVLRYLAGDIRTNTNWFIKQIFSISKKSEIRLVFEKESSYRELIFTVNSFF